MSAELLAHHVDLLDKSAINIGVAVEAGVTSIPNVADIPEPHQWCKEAPGIDFVWHALDGAVVHQYRPDKPAVDSHGGERKYLWESRPLVIGIHPSHRDRIGAKKVLIVEGTKQHLAAVSHAPDDCLVLGIAGCNGWSTNGAPNPDLAQLVPDGADVVVIFDADISTNRNVYDAAAGLREGCEALGADSVRFATIPGSKTTGLDDYLFTIPVPDRRRIFTNIIGKAGKLSGRPPAKKKVEGECRPGDEFFDKEGLRADTFAEAVAASGHYALGQDREIWTYRHGVYVREDAALVEITRAHLGERWRQFHHRTALDLLAARLATEGRVLGDEPIGEHVNVANGMLDIVTGELHPHHPKHLSFAQLPVAWDPKAKCPTFDAWLLGRVGSQVADLLEAIGLLLTPLVRQRKVLFFIGPSRSGKGTLVRLLEALVGKAYVSAVTLHQMTPSNRFSKANLYGKILNAAGDLSDLHIEDLSTFKEITGDDLVDGERKFGHSFTFHSRALIIFSANTPPTVSETSRAYHNRIRPYLFPFSYEDREDQAVEAGLLEEMPGILVRLVEGAQRWHSRRGYLPINPLVLDHFARASDPVAMFVAQCVEPRAGAFLSTGAMYETYKLWATANNRGTLGKNKFLGRAENTLGGRVRHGGGSGPWGWRDWAALPEDEWQDAEGYAQTAESVSAAQSMQEMQDSPYFSPHEESELKEGGVRENSHEGGIGPEVAFLASPPPTCEDAPVEHGRMVF